MIYTGDDGRVLGNIVRAAKKLLKVLKDLKKYLFILLINKINSGKS